MKSPLASRTSAQDTWMRSVGQQHIIGKDKLLYRAIKADKLQLRYDLYGPPGTGKTTLAKVIAEHHQRRFYADQCHGGG